MLIQFQNDYVEVTLDKDATAMVLIWKDYVPSGIYRAALEQALEIAREHQISNWISDIRQLKILEAADQAWVSTDWLNKAITAGCYKKQAVIMAEDIFGQAAARNILAAINEEQIEIQYFNSLEAAKAWLLATEG